MPTNKYYPNNGHECSRSSLANLLVELGNPSMAKIVFDNYRRHEFIVENGSLYGALFPRVMRDLTLGEFSGVVYGHLPSDLERQLKELYPGKWENVLKAILEDRLGGEIQDAPQRCKVSCPLILMIEPKIIPYESSGQIMFESVDGNRQHVLVMKDEDTFIDNGFKVNYNLNDLPVVGCFEGKKVK